MHNVKKNYLILLGIIGLFIVQAKPIFASDIWDRLGRIANNVHHDARGINDIKKDNPVVGEAVEKAWLKLFNAGVDAVADGVGAAQQQRAHQNRMEENAEKIKAIGEQARMFFSDKRTIVGIGVIVASFFILKNGTAVAAKYAESLMGKPQLVQETSIQSVFSKAKNALFGEMKPKLTAKDIILAASLKKEFIDVVKMTQRNRMRGNGFSHLMFYGPPGTGKTLGAKIIAQISGMDYAIVAGSSFSQFDEGKDIQELDKLIRWAERSPNGLVLFIDEADSALGVRNGKNHRADNLVNFFLSNFEKTTHPKIKLVIATNHPEKLDPAVLSRISRTVYIGLPAKLEREEQIKLNLEKLFLSHSDDKISIDKEVYENLPSLAEMIDGFTGRDIFDLVIQMKEAAILADSSSLTWDIAQEAIQKSIASNKAREMLRAKQTGHVYFDPQSVK